MYSHGLRKKMSHSAIAFLVCQGPSDIGGTCEAHVCGGCCWRRSELSLEQVGDSSFAFLNLLPSRTSYKTGRGRQTPGSKSQSTDLNFLIATFTG